MTTFEVILILWYASGATLAYGLFMGNYMVRFAPILGVRGKDIRHITMISALSWATAILAVMESLFITKKLVLCWNMSLMYPLNPNPKLKQLYIEKYGEIK